MLLTTLTQPRRKVFFFRICAQKIQIDKILEDDRRERVEQYVVAMATQRNCEHHRLTTPDTRLIEARMPRSTNMLLYRFDCI